MKTIQCTFSIGNKVSEGETVHVLENTIGNYKFYEGKDSQGFYLLLNQHEFENYFIEVK